MKNIVEGFIEAFFITLLGLLALLLLISLNGCQTSTKNVEEKLVPCALIVHNFLDQVPEKAKYEVASAPETVGYVVTWKAEPTVFLREVLVITQDGQMVKEFVEEGMVLVGKCVEPHNKIFNVIRFSGKKEIKKQDT